MNSYEDRMTTKPGEFTITQAQAGEHSQTHEELTSKRKLEQYALLSMLSGEKLTARNTEQDRYYMTRLGEVLKQNKDVRKLNLDSYVWELAPEYAKVIEDTSVCQELTDFKDYYANSEEMDLNSEKQL